MIQKKFGILGILRFSFTDQGNKSIFIYSGLLICSCLYQVLVYYIGIKIPEFYTVLQQKDSQGFIHLVLLLMILIIAASVSKSGMDWAGGWFSLVLRRSLTLKLHTDLLKNLYDLNFTDLDNPDQRIAQDVDKFALSAGYILEKIVISPLLMLYYTIQLVQIDGWSAPLSLLTYFFVSLAISRVVIGPMGRVIFKKEEKEGDFRHVHLRLLNSVESVCFLNGQHAEKKVLDSKLADLLIYQKYLINWQMILSFLTGTLDYLGTLISYTVVAVPIFMGAVEPDA